MKMEIKIDCRYFVELMQETRSLLRDIRQRLDEWERVCDAACDSVLPIIIAQADLLMPSDGNDARK